MSNFNVHANNFTPGKGGNDGFDPKSSLKNNTSNSNSSTNLKLKPNESTSNKKNQRNRRNGNYGNSNSNSKSNPNNNSHGNTNGNTNRQKPPGGGGSRKESQKSTTDFSLTDILQSENRNKRGEISISHLLGVGSENSRYQNNSRRGGGGGNNSGRYYTTSQSSPSNSFLDKISYINMTCRFVLDSRTDYKFLLNDPDSHVPMDNVLRVICQPATCPICLEGIPEAPRMLECGHLICYPCLLRYLASEGLSKVINDSTGLPVTNSAATSTITNRFKKGCPLCFERIRVEKVKAVNLAQIGDERFDIPKINDEVILRLMFRPNDSLLAVPRDTHGVKKRDFYDLPLIDNSDINQCSRLIKGSIDYAIKEYEREISELKKSREQNRLLYQDDGYWHTEAIKMIQEMINVYKSGLGGSLGLEASPSIPAPGLEAKKVASKSSSPVDSNNSPQISLHSGQSTPQVYRVGDLQIEGDIPLGAFETEIGEPLNKFTELKIDNNNDDSNSDSITATVSTPSHIPTTTAFYDNFHDDNAFFFYQTGGLQASTKFFLAPLDIRILKKTFGNYSNFPAFLVVKVDNVLYGTSVNDEIRRRMKYLGHLPSQTPVGFLECDWRNIVPNDILKSFTKELQLRRRRKHDKEKREERDQKRVQRDEEEQFRRDLLSESSYPYNFAIPVSETSTSTEGIFDSDPISPVPVVASTSPESTTWGKASFAKAAATSRAEQDGRIINEILGDAEHSRKGRKKIILMSNRH